MLRNTRPAFIAILLAVGLLATGCDSDSGESFSDTPPEGFTLVGTWGVTSIEGAPGSVNASTSTWVFQENGTYTWFLDLPPFDESGGGFYTLEGRTLFVTGIVANTVISEAPDGSVQLSFGDDAFQLRDDDGDRWTYRRVE